jgi:hypothetical protein
MDATEAAKIKQVRHDMNNILATILLQASVFAEAEDPKLRSTVEKILKSCEKGKLLMETL